MKRFGFGKKDKAEESEDPNRSRLFSSKSKPQSPAPAQQNPYAIQQNSGPDPYAKQAPYPSSNGYGGIGAPQGNQPPPYQSAGYGGADSNRARLDKSPVPPGGYGGNRYGNSAPQRGGYGSDSRQSGSEGGSSYGASAYGSSRGTPGGYGGLGRHDSSETTNTDAGRQQLFGNASQRYEQKQPQQLPPDHDQSGFGGSGVEQDPSQGYGTYQDRQLTAEEEEEEEVQGTKDQVRMIKQQDVSSTRNALRIAQQAEETGRSTLERLGQQGERIHETEKNLDLASNQNRLAEDKARELKHLNRSMFAVQVNNPFTKASRKAERDQAILDQHRSEREQRDATRAAAYGSQSRQQEHQRDLRNGPGGAQKKSNLAERSKYQFEADSEDEAMEDEIDGNLDALHGAAGRLNQLGRAMGKEVDSQNVHIDRIAGKADKVDDHIAMNRAKLDRIR
ncbi:MAG: Meiosis-specific subunit of the t-SNARE complex [Chrysothrix sp. TS-e1954]|nr:MAG: Meiosis-specific subunit of the t-SNARE complex [Chrysothrix sp. TS-e1954]